DPTYAFGSPIFNKVTINLENGKKFTVKAESVSKDNKYIQSVTLNGKEYNKSWVKHEDIMNGSTLIFKMGDSPNKTWGEAKESRPFTEPLEPFVSLPYAVTFDQHFLQTGKVELKCQDREAKIYFTTDGTEPTESSMLYKKSIVVNKTTQIRFTAFREGILSSTPVSIQLNKLEYQNYTDYTNKLKFALGLNYKYYHVHVINPFELDEHEPIETGIISRITADERKREDYFGYAFEGYLKIPKDGIYSISISSNDGNVFYLDGEIFDGGSYAIRKGIYKISQKYFQLGNKKWDRVFWEGPGISKEEIPAKYFFHNK
ncbi:MAG: glycoside hydrolase domain-containing protein, partial [Melioribacteraceae bacterium]